MSTRLENGKVPAFSDARRTVVGHHGHHDENIDNKCKCNAHDDHESHGSLDLEHSVIEQEKGSFGEKDAWSSKNVYNKKFLWDMLSAGLGLAVLRCCLP